jgi:hypothetical protein
MPEIPEGVWVARQGNRRFLFRTEAGATGVADDLEGFTVEFTKYGEDVNNND